MKLTPKEREKIETTLSAFEASRKEAKALYRKFAFLLFAAIVGFVIYIFPSVHDTQVRLLLIAGVVVAVFGLLIGDPRNPDDIRPWNFGQGNRPLTGRMGVDSAVRALFRKLGVPEKTIISTTTCSTRPRVIGRVIHNPGDPPTLSDLPPELADYPGVRQLLEQAQKQGSAAVTQGLAAPARESRSSEGNIKSRRIHDVSELPPELADNPEIRKLVEDARGSAVLFSTEHVLSKAEALSNPEVQRLLKDAHLPNNAALTENGLSTNPAGLRGDTSPGLPDDASPDDSTVENFLEHSDFGPIRRASQVVNWAALIVLCIALAFAVASLYTLFSSRHGVH